MKTLKSNKIQENLLEFIRKKFLKIYLHHFLNLRLLSHLFFNIFEKQLQNIFSETFSIEFSKVYFYLQYIAMTKILCRWSGVVYFWP